MPFLAKLIPPAALAYLVFPVDIISDPLLGLGQLDDLAVLLLGVKLFIEVAPPDIVREHLAALGARISEWRVSGEEKSGPPAVVEGDYTIVDTEADEIEEEPEATEGELADTDDYM